MEKLEQLRTAIINELQGADTVLLESAEQIEAIAAAMERSPEDTKHVDEVAIDCLGVPACSRVRLTTECTSKVETANAIRNLQPNDVLSIWTRPFGTKREPLTDSFGQPFDIYMSLLHGSRVSMRTLLCGRPMVAR